MARRDFYPIDRGGKVSTGASGYPASSREDAVYEEEMGTADWMMPDDYCEIYGCHPFMALELEGPEAVDAVYHGKYRAWRERFAGIVRTPAGIQSWLELNAVTDVPPSQQLKRARTMQAGNLLGLRDWHRSSRDLAYRLRRALQEPTGEEFATLFEQLWMDMCAEHALDPETGQALTRGSAASPIH